jgi:hypothetical protein
MLLEGAADCRAGGIKDGGKDTEERWDERAGYELRFYFSFLGGGVWAGYDTDDDDDEGYFRIYPFWRSVVATLYIKE